MTRTTANVADRRKGSPRRNPANNAETARQLNESLAETERGLRTFLQSLERAGMRDALDGYRQLQAVLIQQRMWARTQNRFEMDTRFRALGGVCADIHDLLGGYVEIMGRLQHLADLRADTAPASEQRTATPKLNQDETKVLAFILMLGPASPARIGRELGLPRETLQPALDRLCELQMLHATGRGGGQAFRLTPAASAAAISALAGGDSG